MMAISRFAAFTGALILVAAIGVLPTQLAGATAPPTTFVGIPSNNATVSGTSQLLDAGASAGATNVQYEISGGTLTNQIIATAVPTYFGWLARWNTTTVANGTYSLQSLASFSGAASATSAPITVTVNNAAPMVQVIIPTNGATLDESVGYLADAIASPGVTSVSITFVIPAVASSTTYSATPTIFGWIVQTPAFTKEDCGLCSQFPFSLQIQASASYASGLTGESSVVDTTALLWAPT